MEIKKIYVDTYIINVDGIDKDGILMIMCKDEMSIR